MIACHCNVVAEDTILTVIEDNLEKIREASCLLEAVGMVWRNSVDLSRDHRNPFSCTACFKRVARHIQKDHNLFAEENLPERKPGCDTCPRREQCGINFQY